MMHNFLSNNRVELISRCAAKVAKRPLRNATASQVQNGVPMFLDQLTRALEAEQDGERAAGLAISGASGGAGSVLSEIGVSAAAHGKELLKLDYTVDQVVHDYGDLCQAITDLAVERDAPFSIDEFRTLNRCLDNAIADAVTEFSFQRDSAITLRQANEVNQRLGFLMHELRNSLNAAVLAVEAMKAGNLPLTGATGGVLQRSHLAMDKLIQRSLAEVKVEGRDLDPSLLFSLADFIAEAKSSGQLDAASHGCLFTVADVEVTLALDANRELILAALANLLNNAFKFTHAKTEVTLTAYAMGERILIEVQDKCGGLPAGNAERMFIPFSQRGDDKTGVGLGLSIARQSVMADGGTLSVKNLPGDGCVFTIDLPRRTMH
jgi:signal transduction histidine kinase